MMRYGGLTETEALRTITLNGAIQLGVQDRVGSVEVGKDADLGIWSGHPFSVYSRVDATLIDGEVFFDRTADATARMQLAAERAELEKAEPNVAPGAPGRGNRTTTATPSQENR